MALHPQPTVSVLMPKVCWVESESWGGQGAESSPGCFKWLVNGLLGGGSDRTWPMTLSPSPHISAPQSIIQDIIVGPGAFRVCLIVMHLF